ncbi:hypothetical protein OC834_002687 [Tilletia horrida]|nr:hypothetical protein OC834_002687 [Tilletia horrida]
MSHLCKSPLLLISTALLFAGANVALAASVAPAAPLTPPESPVLASGDFSPFSSAAHSHHVPESFHRGSHFDTFPDAHDDDGPLHSSSDGEQKRYLTGFGAAQSGGERPKNTVRSTAHNQHKRSASGKSEENAAGADAGVRHGSANAPAHLQHREVEGQMERADGSQGRGDAAAHGGEADGSPVPAAVSSRQEGGVMVRRRRFDGKGTYYRVGMGACGWHNDSDQFVAAIAQSQYRGGSYCGRNARVCHNGTCVTVKLVDECPGCSYGSLDLSPAAFRSLAPLRIGVIDISWSFA